MSNESVVFLDAACAQKAIVKWAEDNLPSDAQLIHDSALNVFRLTDLNGGRPIVDAMAMIEFNKLGRLFRMKQGSECVEIQLVIPTETETAQIAKHLYHSAYNWSFVDCPLPLSIVGFFLSIASVAYCYHELDHHWRQYNEPLLTLFDYFHKLIDYIGIGFAGTAFFVFCSFIASTIYKAYKIKTF